MPTVELVGGNDFEEFLICGNLFQLNIDHITLSTVSFYTLMLQHLTNSHLGVCCELYYESLTFGGNEPYKVTSIRHILDYLEIWFLSFFD
ncbi:CLUMA_CG019223, isoform A [Clunio marinus]|uniref:CLUMA_CG019223, isoform A n=1 Tax=Clunio marinus TaxID=568069 RepID=A0A1J1J1J2_9DIPT|nr:CLUMA_CG019223, isoform A [Clunio marinus]